MINDLFKRMMSDSFRLFQLNKDLEPVRELINEKKYEDANKLCASILEGLPKDFLFRWNRIISMMLDMTQEEFTEWSKTPHKHYPYSHMIEPNDEKPQLPAVIATEPYEIKEYNPIDEVKNT